jgi:hypothetical protein
VTAFVVAFSPSGSVLWSKGFPALGAEDLPVVAVDPAGGAFLALTGRAVVDLRILRLDAAGATLWATDVSLTRAGFGIPSLAAAAPDGGVWVVGNNLHEAIVIHLDASGRSLWSEVWPSVGPVAWLDWGGLAIDSAGRAVLAWTDGGLHVAAYEPSGALAWSRDDWGSAVGALSPHALLAAASGRVLLLAQGYAGDQYAQLTLALGPTGHVEFVASPLDVPSADWAWSVRLDALGHALVLGTGFDAGYRDRVLKYSPSGGLLWASEPLEGQAWPWVQAFDVGPAGEVVAVGSAGSFGLPRVARLEADGSRAWLKTDVVPSIYTE